MDRFEFWEVVLITAFVLWIGFQWCKLYGRDKERKAERLSRQAEKETDSERKKKLLLEWNERERHLKGHFS